MVRGLPSTPATSLHQSRGLEERQLQLQLGCLPSLIKLSNIYTKTTRKVIHSTVYILQSTVYVQAKRCFTSDVAAGGRRHGGHGRGRGVLHSRRQLGRAAVGGELRGQLRPERGLQLLDLLLLLVLLRVGELDDEGRAAALHREAVVHRFDRQDRDLTVGERHECAA